MERLETEHLLHQCLFFTTGRLDRILTKWAEEEFAFSGLAPSAAFGVMVLNDRPGMNQNELSGILHLDPSTLTRFVDKLEARGLVTRRKEGRMTYLEPTASGKILQPELAAGWKRIWERYTKFLGIEEGNSLAAMIHSAGQILEGLGE